MLVNRPPDGETGVSDVRMMVPRALAAALLAGAAVAAQDAAGSPSRGLPKVTKRVLHVRDEPLPTPHVQLTSAGISADGRRVVVGIKSVGRSDLDLLAGRPGWPDRYKRGPDRPTVYVYDCETNSSTELKPALDGRVWRLIGPPAISPDGRFVAAACEPEATYSNEDVGRGSTVAIVDTIGDESRLLDLKSFGVKAPVAWFAAPALARDAAYLALPTTPDFGSGIHHGWTMLWNRDAGTMQAVVFGESYSHTVCPGLSDDGRFLVVGADGSDDGGPAVAFVTDTSSGKTTVVSAWPDGTRMTNGGVWSCAISGNGATAAFVSRPGPNSPTSEHALTSICLHDVPSGTRRLVPVVNDPDWHIDVGGCTLSGSGRYVAYLVRASQLAQFVCLHDIETARTAVLDSGGSGSGWILCASPPALSADGRRAVFIREVFEGSSGDSPRTEAVLAEIEW